MQFLFVFLALFLEGMSVSYALDIKHDPFIFSLLNRENIFTLLNDKPYAVRVKIKMNDFIMLPDAHLQPVKKFPYSLKPYLNLSEEDVFLEVGESKSIILSLHSLSLMDGGDYHSHLTYKEEGGSTAGKVSFDVSLPMVYQSVKGRATVSIVRALVEGGQFILTTTKDNPKKNIKTWVTVNLLNKNKEVPLVSSFYHKVYREAHEVERRLTLQNKPQKGDEITVNIWRTKQEKKLIESLTWIVE